MHYEGDIYRPPSEAYSLIIQATVGCTHNKCTFCPNYKAEQFKLKPFEIVLEDLHEARTYYRHVERVFLADGDVLCLTTDKLKRLLDAVREVFPECNRVGVYGRASQILKKSEDELGTLLEAGLGIVYVGAESGSDEILMRVNKGETVGDIVEAVQKAERVGIKTSVTFISGLGGRELAAEHAAKTGEMISAMGATYVGLLTLMLMPQAPIFADVQSGKFVQLSPLETLDELEAMLENINCEKETVFRSNHASNWIELRGTFPQDKERLLGMVRRAKKEPGGLKPERMRRL